MNKIKTINIFLLFLIYFLLGNNQVKAEKNVKLTLNNIVDSSKQFNDTAYLIFSRSDLMTDSNDSHEFDNNDSSPFFGKIPFPFHK